MPKRRTRVIGSAERRTQRPAQIDAHQLYSVVEVCAALDVSQPQYYRMVASGRLRPLDPPLDSRPRIPGTEILRVLGVTPQPAAAPIGAP
jgi:hypothetical protein